MGKTVRKIEIDKDLCIGCSMCVAASPDVADFNEDENKAFILPNAGSQPDELLFTIAESCPVYAISLYDAEGNKIFPE